MRVTPVGGDDDDDVDDVGAGAAMVDDMFGISVAYFSFVFSEFGFGIQEMKTEKKATNNFGCCCCCRWLVKLLGCCFGFGPLLLLSTF